MKFKSEAEIQEDIERETLIRKRTKAKREREAKEYESWFEKGSKMIDELPEESKKALWEKVRERLKLKTIDNLKAYLSKPEYEKVIKHHAIKEFERQTGRKI